jgi:hypothetical protein
MAERRRIREPYRQGFGRAQTTAFGRPAGWIILVAAIEKITFPSFLVMMAVAAAWEPLLVTIVAETSLCLVALAVVMKGQRLEYLAKGIVTTPIRYAMLASELVTIARFVTDIWIKDNRKWRK